MQNDMKLYKKYKNLIDKYIELRKGYYVGRYGRNMELAIKMDHLQSRLENKGIDIDALLMVNFPDRYPNI